MENFNKLMNKVAAIANDDRAIFHEATYDMLQAYRSTPHPATKTEPYELLMNRQVGTKLDHFPTEMSPKNDIVRRVISNTGKRQREITTNDIVQKNTN